MSQPRCPILSRTGRMSPDTRAAPAACQVHAARLPPSSSRISEHELLVDLRTDQRSRRVADPDQLRPFRNLGGGEAQFQPEHKVEQAPHKNGIVVEIEHQVVDSPQVGALRAGTLNQSPSASLRPLAACRKPAPEGDCACARRRTGRELRECRGALYRSARHSYSSRSASSTGVASDSSRGCARARAATGFCTGSARPADSRSCSFAVAPASAARPRPSQSQCRACPLRACTRHREAVTGYSLASTRAAADCALKIKTGNGADYEIARILIIHFAGVKSPLAGFHPR